MKLLSFRPTRARFDHFGVLLSNGKALDITELKSGRALPAALIDCIRGGAESLARVRDAATAAEQQITAGNTPAHIVSLDDVVLCAPLKPGKIMAIGKNYADHAAETGSAAYSRPAGFIKHVDTIIASGEVIRKPAWTEKLDYENELAVVIADECVDVLAEETYDHVFGYTIMNDVSARDVQIAERKEGNIMIGKNFPTAAPLGPWIVTKDEIPDPHNLMLVTRVNGEVRQHANTSTQIFHIPAQMAWYSQAGFQPGDIISTGTPSGVAMGYKGEGSWYLKNGDEIECEIEKIGVLKNTVSTRKRRS
jgi:2-keto-4-pentenoate hydratase/2-oxohepta-3-ene-1,7-dioic acid hydratase in catechol pathway